MLEVGSKPAQLYVRPSINETQFLPGSGCVDTAKWMHHMDANEAAGEETRRKLHKNVESSIKKSWRQHPTRLQLYGHLPPITKTIQVRRTRHAGHCWRSKDELISDVLLWTPTYGCAKVGRPARTYIQQLCEDTGCNPEDLPEAMNDREKWRERVRDICAGGATWWWWWYIYIEASVVIIIILLPTRTFLVYNNCFSHFSSFFDEQYTMFTFPETKLYLHWHIFLKSSDRNFFRILKYLNHF